MEPHRDNRYETISCSSRTSSLAAPPPPHSRAPRAPCVARSRLPPPPRAAKSSFVYAWRRAAALNLLSLSCSSFAASKCPACFKARILKVASSSSSFHPPPRKVLRLRRRLPLVPEVFLRADRRVRVALRLCKTLRERELCLINLLLLMII